MYFVMVDSQIVGEYYYQPSDAQLQEIANDLEIEVWVLQGEHFGMTAYPEQQEDTDEDQE